ncbi:MAG: heparinase II/III family protein [Pseudomonadota bacterium]
MSEKRRPADSAAGAGGAAREGPSLPRVPGYEPVTVAGRLLRRRGPSLAARIGEQGGALLRGLGYRSLVYSWRLRGSFPLKLIASPADPWPGAREHGEAIASGLYGWAGYRIEAPLPPFADEAAPEAFLVWLHSFRWLRDLAALNDPRRAMAIAEPAVRAWVDQFAHYHPVAWRPEVIGERFIHWTSHAPLILATNDLVYRSKVLNSLARQARHLARAAARAPEGMARLTAAAGLVYSGLLLPGGEARQHKGGDLLARELARFVLPDGGVATRSPADMLMLLQRLIALRAVYRDRQAAPPEALQIAIDRLVPALKGLRHSDGGLAAFNGARGGAARDLGLALDLAECDAEPTNNGALSGYQRMARGGAVVIIDAGPPPAMPYSRAAHAGTLALEFSHDGERLIVNCGSALGDAAVPSDMAAMTRTTAAHSALVFADTNAAQLRRDGLIGRAAQGVGFIRREGEAGLWLDLDHDGYGRKFGLMHTRRLFLAASGLDLRGEDRLSAAPGHRPRATGRRFDIRFHLHPGVEATPTQDGQAAILRLANRRDGWMFRARGATLAIADSLMIDEMGRLRRTRQLVLSGTVAALPSAINWSLKAMTA